MKILPINNNTTTNFSGIPLENAKFGHLNDYARHVSEFLELNGFECLGHKDYYVSNTDTNKIKSILKENKITICNLLNLGLYYFHGVIKAT